MISFKTSPKLASNINYMKNQQSDIFIQKGLNKPEIEYKHKKIIPSNTFNSSYNFLEWNNTTPYQNTSIKIKQNPNNISHIFNSEQTNYNKYNSNKVAGGPQKHKTFYEKMHQDEPNKNPNKSDLYLKARYQKETMNLGDYEGNEYKIKKNKSLLYDPSPYYENKNPLKQKMNLIYGGSDNIIGNYKPAINRNNKMIRSSSSIGFAKRNFETRNEYDPKIINNPKEMKYFLIYGNKGIENANKKLKPISISRSTNNEYIPGEDCTQNRLNFLKSNIFNDEKNNDNDLKDNNDNNQEKKEIKVNRNIRKKMGNRAKSAHNILVKNKSNNNEEINNKENHAKRFLYKHNDEKLPNMLKWNDPQLYLLFPQKKDSEILKKNARERKFDNIYGTDPILPKGKLCEEFKSNERPEIDEATKNNIKNLNYSQMKRISDNISQLQGDKFINQINKNNNRNIQSKDKRNIDNEVLTYEIKLKNTKNKKNISNYDIEKQFADKGIHIYDIIENMGSVLSNKNDNTIVFKIRENNKDKNFEGKIKKIKKELKDNGFVMNEKINKKKENTDIMPQTLKWDDPHFDLLTKNKIAVKTNEEKTHSKPHLNVKNEEEKITKICVNLKYKNGTNHY